MKRLLLAYLRPYRAMISLVVVLVSIQVIANLYLPDLNAKIINNGVAKGDTAYIVRVGGLMLLVALLVGVCSIASVYWGSKVAMLLGRDVRGALFRKVESFSQAEVNLFGTPSLITRNTNDVQQVQMLVALGLNMMIMAPLMCIGGHHHGHAPGPAPLGDPDRHPADHGPWSSGPGGPRGPALPAMQVKLDRINQVMRETLSGMRVIRAFVRNGLRGAPLRRGQRGPGHDGAAGQPALRPDDPDALRHPQPLHGRHHVVRGKRVASGAMPIGNLTAFLAYVMQILIAVMMATVMMAMVPRAAASGDRIQQVLDVDPSIADPAVPAEAWPAATDAGASSSSRTWSSATRARRTRCSRTSLSPPPPARPRPSWAARAAASPP